MSGAGLVSRARSVTPRRFPRPSRIGVRLLAFNLLLLFLPIAGILYLDVYEARLLEAQERGMIQQGRVIAAALSDRDPLDPAIARDLLGRLAQRGDARYRIYDASGAAIADTNSVRLAGEPAAGEGVSAFYPANSGIRARLLYRIGAWVVRVRAAASGLLSRLLRVDRGQPPALQSPADATPIEVRSALAGKYGAATRPTPGQRSLTLSSAVPIARDNAVMGAVLVSQSTFRVLQALYDVRLRVFEVVVASLGAAALLTALAAKTVVRPLGRLRGEAAALAERRSRLPGRFRGTDRRDELGDLARALQELTRRLAEHIHEVERFASDVAHEFKNPLAAIRTAAEMAGQAETPHERQRFLDLLKRDADRLDRLVSSVRELARMDAQLEQEPVERVDAGEVLAQVIDGLRLSQGGEPAVVLHTSGAKAMVRGSADRLAQAFENVLSNARSFAPGGTVVDVRLDVDEEKCTITVLDSGPGIPDAHVDRVFDRFFTYRPGSTVAARHHAGLGLAIARSIVQGYGGSITAANRPERGAAFQIRLPLWSDWRSA